MRPPQRHHQEIRDAPIDGIDENDIDINDLAKQLKNKCAAGGTAKDGRIELQGDHKKKVKIVLEDMGFRTEVR